MTLEVSGADVLEYLIPTGGWSITGNSFEGITFIEATPITKAEFEAGFAIVAEAKAIKETEKATAKAELLTRLGITEDEAKLLLS